jgi:hypothetical protein
MRASRNWTALVAATLLSVCSVSASAAEYYGALAYSNTTGAFGDSRDYPSRSQAEDKAMSECSKRGKGCKLLITLRNECGALATGKNYGYGFAAAVTRGEAEQVALKYCRKNASDCKIAVWVCTTR